jgi:hypothetical protein
VSLDHQNAGRASGADESIFEVRIKRDVAEQKLKHKYLSLKYRDVL